MLFTTDKQTLEDLNIFGRHGGESVFNIFNRCITKGGAAIMEEMFRYPLSDEKAINRRSGIIQYFAANGTVFPMQSALFDAAEAYLANTDERTKLQPEEPGIGRKLGHLIGTDTETTMLVKGISALVELMKNMHRFIASLNLPEDHGYFPEKAAVTALLSEPDLAPVFNSKGRPSGAAMAAYDALLRFRHRSSMQQLLRHIYHLDVYVSVAKVAQERGFVFPAALPENRHMLHLKGVFHPQLKNAVPNTIHVTPDNNVTFLTGANMAGKSTFMKSLGIAVFLAHMGFPVAAERMEFSVLNGIYTTINLPDDLGMGASHFYAEVLRVKKMAQELSQSRNLLIIFDELFRGTNVKDAYEATIAVTEGFAGKRGSLFVISTHIIEAGEVLRQSCRNIRFIFLPTRMQGNTPVYTYTLEEGITDDRHGMVIINNAQILDILAKGTPKEV